MPALATDTPMDTPHLDLELAAVPASVTDVRRRLRRLAAEVALPGSVQGDVALAASEACTNVVLHAYATSGDDDGVLLVRARVRDGALEIEIGDRGPGMAARCDSPGLGLGLPLIARVADAVDVGPGPHGGTTISMRFAGARTARATAVA